MPDHDDLDRDLAQRLSAYESRMPDADPPDLTAAPSGRRAVLGGILALGAVAGVLLAAFLLGRPPPQVGDASPSPTPSVEASSTATPTDWGPLAVVESTGDLALTEGTLRMTGRCVFLDTNGRSSLLVWPAGQTRWNPDQATISLSTIAGGDVTLASGQPVALGGSGWSASESGQDPREWAASVDWIEAPDDTCLINDAWFVTDVVTTPEPTASPLPSPSPVAVRWHPIPMPDSTGLYSGVAGITEWTDGLMAYGRADHTHGGIWLSEDGLNWVVATVPESPAGSAVHVTDVVNAGDHYLAFGTLAHPDGSGPTGGVLWYSSDGRVWTELSREYPGSFLGMSGQTILAAIPYEIPNIDDVVVSRDGGITWSPVERPDPWHIGGEALIREGVFYLPGSVVGSGVDDSTAAIWASADAVDWTRSDLAAAIVTDVSSMPDGSLIAVGAYEAAPDDPSPVWTSRDGATWAPTSEIGECCLGPFTSTPDGVVAVGWFAAGGEADPPSALISITQDALTWSVARVQGWLADVTFTERFGIVMVGNDERGRPGVVLDWPFE